MNIINSLTQRIEERLTETKNPCKNYATEEAAEKATAKMAYELAKYFTVKSEEAYSCRYVVFYIKSMDRWVGGIDQTELMQRSSTTGGYIGYASCKGWYCY